jgi:hypothetical protein
MALPTAIDTANDRFTVTNYVSAGSTATVTFLVGGTSYPGVVISGVPVDSVASVKAYLLGWATAYLNGKNVEQNKTIVADPSVAALLNVATPFV